MDDRQRMALFMELANVMNEMGHSVKSASLDENGLYFETRQGDVEVRFWVTVKKSE